MADSWTCGVWQYCYSVLPTTNRFPFQVPLSDDEAKAQWKRFNQLKKHAELTSLLADVFVPIKERLSAESIVDKVGNMLGKQMVGPPTRPNDTGTRIGASHLPRNYSKNISAKVSVHQTKLSKMNIASKHSNFKVQPAKGDECGQAPSKQ